MPRGDGTGPLGYGPGTGGGFGPCGYGLRGRWAAPWGRGGGWRGRWMADVPPRTAGWGASAADRFAGNPEDECEVLRRNAERLEAELDAIRERLDAMKGE